MRVSFGFSRGELILIRACLQHARGPVWPLMAFDTGARLTVITPKLARELGIDPDKAEATVEVSGAIGTASAALLEVASISVLTAEVRDLRVACHPLSPRLGLDGILGLNFLERFNIEINNEDERVILTRWRE